MTTPEGYPAGVDPVHVRATCMAAAPGTQREGIVVLAGRNDGVRVFLTHRVEATAARAALRRVGYAADRIGGRQSTRLIVTGWSAERLESRLTTMRTVAQRLAAEPGATAARILDRLGRQPEVLPSMASLQELVIAARHELREWITGTSGIHARCDPRARPADTGAALRLSACRQAETAIDMLAALHLRVAVHAVALYPELREQMSFYSARDLAVYRAEVAVFGSARSAGRPAARPWLATQPHVRQAHLSVAAGFPDLPLSADLATQPQPARRTDPGHLSPRSGRQR